MAQRNNANKKNSNNGANLGFEQKLWQAADKMRGHMDSAEYKHVVLGLIFLKYISDAFHERHEALKKEPNADPEDRDEYTAENVFWVPKKARWSNLQANAKQASIGKLIDDAMEEIEKANPVLKAVLPKDYNRPALDKHRLGELIDLIADIGLGDKESRSKDILGRVYEYFLSQFASAEGKIGGEFYTPRCIVKLLVEMIEPYKGRVYDPCCGSSGMFVQSEEFIKQHGGQLGDISIYGQESNPTTWKLAKMNLAIRGIEANLGPQHADTFHNDLHKDLKADFVLANGSMSSNQSGEGEIRQKMVEADLVDCMIALPPQLFYGTQIPACLWFLARNKTNGKFRDRRKHTLFIDARKMGHLVDRVHRDLSNDDIDRIAGTYHTRRGENGSGKYKDVPGFCRSATTDEIATHGFILTPGRYVGAEEQEDDGELFEDKM